MFFIAFTEGEPEKFTIGALDQNLRIAVPFQVINLIISTCVATILCCKLSTMLQCCKYYYPLMQFVDRVPTVLENPGKSLNLKNKIPGLESP